MSAEAPRHRHASPEAYAGWGALLGFLAALVASVAAELVVDAFGLGVALVAGPVVAFGAVLAIPPLAVRIAHRTEGKP